MSKNMFILDLNYETLGLSLKWVNVYAHINMENDIVIGYQLLPILFLIQLKNTM